jgi:hypothetical protein
MQNWKSKVRKRWRLLLAHSSKMVKQALVVSFPHLALLTLVFMYGFFGASILNELEVSSSNSSSSSAALNFKTPPQNEQASTHAKLNPSQIFEAVMVNAKRELLKQIEVRLLLIDEKEIELKFNQLLLENNFITARVKPASSKKSHKAKGIERDVLRRVRRLLLRHKPRSSKRQAKRAKVSVRRITKVVSLYLSDYKSQLNASLSRVVSKFLAEFKLQQKNAIKRVLHQVKLDYKESTDDDDNYSKADHSEIEEKVEPMPKRSSSLFFIITQLTSIGKIIFSCFLPRF